MNLIASIYAVSARLVSERLVSKPFYRVVTVLICAGFALPSVATEPSVVQPNAVYAYDNFNNPYLEYRWSRFGRRADTRGYRLDFFDNAAGLGTPLRSHTFELGRLSCGDENDLSCFYSLRLTSEMAWPTQVSLRLTRLLSGSGNREAQTSIAIIPPPPDVTVFLADTLGQNAVLTWFRREPVVSFDVYSGDSPDSVDRLVRGDISLAQAGCFEAGDISCEIQIPYRSANMGRYARIASVSYGGERRSIVRELVLHTNRHTKPPEIARVIGKNVTLRWDNRDAVVEGHKTGDIQRRIYWGNNPEFTQNSAVGFTTHPGTDSERTVTINYEGTYYFKLAMVVNGVQTQVLSPPSAALVHEFAPNRPPAPEARKVGSNGVALSWARVALVVEPLPTRYRVYRGTNANFAADNGSDIGTYSLAQLGCSAALGLQCRLTVPNNPQGNQYFRLRAERTGAFGSGAASPVSTAVNITTAPATPTVIATDLRANYAYDGLNRVYLELRWRRPTSDTSKYQVRYYLTPQATLPVRFEGGNDLGAVACAGSDTECFYSQRLDGRLIFDQNRVWARVLRFDANGWSLGESAAVAPPAPAVAYFSESTAGGRSKIIWGRRDEVSSFNIYTGSTADATTTLLQRNLSPNSVRCALGGIDRSCEWVFDVAQSPRLDKYVRVSVVTYGGETHSNALPIGLRTYRYSEPPQPSKFTRNGNSGNEVRLRWRNTGAPTAEQVRTRVYWGDFADFSKTTARGSTAVGGMVPNLGLGCAGILSPSCELIVPVRDDDILYFKTAMVVNGVESQVLSPPSVRFVHDLEPNAPRNLRLIRASADSVRLLWERRPSERDALPTRYRIFSGSTPDFRYGRAAPNAQIHFLPIADFNCDARRGAICSKLIQNLPGGAHYFRVQAQRGQRTNAGYGKVSARTAPFLVVPLAIHGVPTVTFLRANPDNTSAVRIAWTRPSIRGNPQIGFKIYRSNSPKFNGATANEQTAFRVSSLAAANCAADLSCQVTIPDVPNGPQYFHIIALNQSAAGELRSPASPAGFADLTATAPPLIAANGVQQARTNHQLSFRVTARPTNGDAVSYHPVDKATCVASPARGHHSVIATPGNLDADSGVFIWRPTSTGRFNFCVAARDKDGDALTLVRVEVAQDNFVLPAIAGASVATNIRAQYAYDLLNRTYLELRWHRASTAVKRYELRYYLNPQATGTARVFGGTHLGDVQCAHSDSECFYSLQLDGDFAAHRKNISVRLVGIDQHGRVIGQPTAPILAPAAAVSGVSAHAEYVPFGTSHLYYRGNTDITWRRRDEVSHFRIYTGPRRDSDMKLFRDNIYLHDAKCANSDRDCFIRLNTGEALNHHTPPLSTYIRVASVLHGNETRSVPQAVERLSYVPAAPWATKIVEEGRTVAHVDVINGFGNGDYDRERAIYYGDNPDFTVQTAEGSTPIRDWGQECLDPYYSEDCRIVIYLEREGRYYFKVRRGFDSDVFSQLSPPSAPYWHDHRPNKPSKPEVVSQSQRAVVLRWRRAPLEIDALPTRYSVYAQNVSANGDKVLVQSYHALETGCGPNGDVVCEIAVPTGGFAAGNYRYYVKPQRGDNPRNVASHGPLSDGSDAVALSPPSAAAVRSVSAQVAYDLLGNPYFELEWVRPSAGVSTQNYSIRYYTNPDASGDFVRAAPLTPADAKCSGNDIRCFYSTPLDRKLAWPAQVSARILRVDGNAYYQTDPLRPRPGTVIGFRTRIQNANLILNWSRRPEVSSFKLYSGAKPDTTTLLVRAISLNEASCAGSDTECEFSLPIPTRNLDQYVRLAALAYGGETISPVGQQVGLLHARHTHAPRASASGKDVLVRWNQGDAETGGAPNSQVGRKIYWGNSADFTKVNALGSVGTKPDGIRGDQTTLRFEVEAEYYFKIALIVNGVEGRQLSPSSEPLWLDFEPDVPANVRVGHGATPNTAVVHWQRKPAHQDALPTQYRIYSGQVFTAGVRSEPVLRGTYTAAQLGCASGQGVGCKIAIPHFIGGAHYFRVRAQRGSGADALQSAQSPDSPDLFIVPQAIATAPVRNIVGNKVVITWERNSTHGEPHNGFVIYQSREAPFRTIDIVSNHRIEIHSLAAAHCATDTSCQHTFGNYHHRAASDFYKVAVLNYIHGVHKLESPPSAVSTASHQLRPPVIAPIPPQHLIVGDSLRLRVAGRSQNVAAIAYRTVTQAQCQSATGINNAQDTPGSLDPSSGELVWNLPSAGAYQFCVAAADVGGVTYAVVRVNVARSTVSKPLLRRDGVDIVLNWRKALNATGFEIHFNYTPQVDTHTLPAATLTPTQAQCAGADRDCAYTLRDNTPGTYYFAVVATKETVDFDVSEVSEPLTVPPVHASPITASSEGEGRSDYLVGDILTASAEIRVGQDSTTYPVTRQHWQRCDDSVGACRDIVLGDVHHPTLATATTYRIRTADIGKWLRVGVNAETLGDHTNPVSARILVSDRPGTASLAIASVGVPSRVRITDPDDPRNAEIRVTANQWQVCTSATDLSTCANRDSNPDRSYTPESSDQGSYLRAIQIAYTGAGGVLGRDITDPVAIAQFSADALVAHNAEITPSAPPYDVGVRLSVSGEFMHNGNRVTASGYQWQRCVTPTSGCANLSGYTTRHYSIRPADRDAWLRVQLRSGSISVFSNAVETDKIGRVSIGGVTTQNEQLYARLTDPDNPAGANQFFSDGVSFQWHRGAGDFSVSARTAIADATTQLYTLTQADVGMRLKVVATYQSFGGGSVTSAATAAEVENVDDLGVVQLAAVTVGQPSTFQLTDPDHGAAQITRIQWQVCTSMDAHSCRFIIGAVDDSYTPTAAQARLYLRVLVSYQGAGGGDEVASNFVRILSYDAEQVFQAVAPKMLQAVSHNILAAITERINQISVRHANGFSVNGASDLATVLKTQAQAEMDDALDPKQLLGTSGFNLWLSESNTARGLGFWGKGHYNAFADEAADDLKWSGELFGFSLGSDTQLVSGAVIGVSLSQHNGEFEIDQNGDISDYEVNIHNLSPYASWHAGGYDFTASLGVGSGQGSLTFRSDNSQTTHDLGMHNASIGVSRHWTDLAETELRIKGEFLHSSTKMQDLRVQSNRVRLLLAAQHAQWNSASGGRFTPNSEIGLRRDGGDSGQSHGLEAGFGLGYAKNRITAEGRVRGLVAHSGAQKQWGVQGNIRFQPGADQQGLALSLAPSYGNAVSRVDELWQRGIEAISTEQVAATPESQQICLDARLSYGWRLGAGGGLVTPYLDADLGAQKRYGIGANWQPQFRGLELDVLSERSDGNRRIVLEGRFGF